MLVQELMSKEIVTMPATGTVYTAALLLREHKVGSVLAVDDSGDVGIVTKRDIISGTILTDKNPHETFIHEIWNTEIITIHRLSTIKEAVKVMDQYHIKKLIVIDDDKNIIGIITVTDISHATKDIEKRLEDSCLNMGTD